MLRDADGRSTGGPGVGDQAPEFALRRGLDEVVELRGLLERGPTLLCFYVFDFGHY
jgi:peroxiredoxin